VPSKQRFLFHLVSCFSKNVVLKWCLAFYQTISRDCLESSWTGWIARFLVARSVEKGCLAPRFAGSWDHEMEPLRSFQTVSLQWAAVALTYARHAYASG
jgi:hypothetical protein